MKAIDVKAMILYEDADILVCQKPSGFPVQSGKTGVMDMESALKNYRMQKDGQVYVAVIHRLDQPVQGILVFAKNKQSAGELSRQLQQGKMKKMYLACVNGIPEEKNGHLVHEMLKETKTNTSRIVEKKTNNSKTAVLDYRVLRERDGKALLEIDLDTGRHHQIRVQLAYMGMPILGDTKYNPEKKEAQWQEIALCAYKLSFFHPRTKKKMEFEIEPAGNFPIV